MIIAIRISGLVDVDRSVEESLFRLRLRRKYSAVLLKTTQQNQKWLHSVRDYVAYGDIDKDTLWALLEKRAKPIKSETKINPDTIITQLEKKSLEDLGIKPFFRLHPPRGGIEVRKHFGVGKGALGDQKAKINVLVRRML